MVDEAFPSLADDVGTPSFQIVAMGAYPQARAAVAPPLVGQRRSIGRAEYSRLAAPRRAERSVTAVTLQLSFVDARSDGVSSSALWSECSLSEMNAELGPPRARKPHTRKPHTRKPHTRKPHTRKPHTRKPHTRKARPCVDRHTAHDA